MSEPTTMTVRIDSALKAAVEAAARAQGISITEYTERALKGALHTTCNTCGRSSIIGAAMPGFSTQFEKWVALQKEHAVNQPILITTREGDHQWVYWAKLGDARPMTDGVLALRIFLDPDGQVEQDYAMPRGEIIGWCVDIDGHSYSNQLLLGAGDGNGRLCQRLIEVERAQRAGTMLHAQRTRRQ